jgi:hypothetical protein
MTLMPLLWQIWPNTLGRCSLEPRWLKPIPYSVFFATVHTPMRTISDTYNPPWTLFWQPYAVFRGHIVHQLTKTMCGLLRPARAARNPNQRIWGFCPVPDFLQSISACPNCNLQSNVFAKIMGTMDSWDLTLVLWQSVQFVRIPSKSTALFSTRETFYPEIPHSDLWCTCNRYALLPSIKNNSSILLWRSRTLMTGWNSFN